MSTYLLDTNVLLRLGDHAPSFDSETARAVEALLEAGHRCVLVPQVLVEFYVVATRPQARNGFGWTPERAGGAVKSWASRFSVLEEAGGSFALWQSLVAKHQVSGKRCHDVRLLASALAHGIDVLLSRNVKDFPQGESIDIASPSDVLNRLA